MFFLPIDKMRERIEIARQDADVSLFLNLLYFGEMVTKIVAAGLIAAVEDDRHRQRYQFAYRLVRADGVGEWSVSIDDVLTGPAAQLLMLQARDEQRELTQRSGPGTWQYDAVALLHKCIKVIEPTYDDLPARVEGRRWFSMFASLRNKTRGHGALPSEVYGKLCTDFERSIQIVTDNFNLFKRPWAFLHQNLSGRYRVTRLTENDGPFKPLWSSSSTISFPDSVYIHSGLSPFSAFRI